MAAWHMEAGLHGDAPPAVHEGGKLLDEEAPQGRLAAAESDAALCGEEVEVVDAHYFHQLFGCQLFPHAVGVVADVVDAIAAVQRAAVEGYQRGDTLAVDGQAMVLMAMKGALLMVVRSLPWG